MKLALFDLDHTLLNTDSDHSWGEFLVNEGLVDPIRLIVTGKQIGRAHV